MGKNINGGKKFKKRKNFSSKERELVFKEYGQKYARIIKKLGDGRFECHILDENTEKNVIAKICGSMRKRVWVNIGDVVLISNRSFDSSSCDIIHKYTLNEASSLKSYNEIPYNINLQATTIDLTSGNYEYGEDDIIFEDI